MRVWQPTVNNLSSIVEVLLAGEVVAVPTETVYGLLADATNTRAVKKIFRIKGRDYKKSSALVVSDYKMAAKFGVFNRLSKKIVSKYWPGPLTIVVNSKGKISPLVQIKKTIALRVPGNNYLRKIIKLTGKPLTATSANLAGRPNIYSSVVVKKRLGKRSLRYLIDGGDLPKRLPSTMVQVINKRIKILRLGAIKVKI